MRKVTFGGANSLDNFFARKDDSVDWLMWEKEVSKIMETFWKTIDTVVMGRRTYEVAERMGGGGEQPGVKTYVFSRTLTTQRARGQRHLRDGRRQAGEVAA
jgi:dihydrofolate reductase